MYLSKALGKQTACRGGRRTQDEFSREDPKAEEKQLFEETILS